jgi:glutaredoxin
MSIVIYTKEDCVYCSMAKNLLNSKNIPYTEKVLSLDFTREELLAAHSLAKTFPVIVVDGFYIGGYTNLVTYIESDAFVQAQAAQVQAEEVLQVENEGVKAPVVEVDQPKTSNRKTSK